MADTNLLLRSLQRPHPSYPIVSRAVEILFARGDDLHVAGQNLIEFWAVATRRASENGLGLTTEETSRELVKLRQTFMPLPDTPDILTEWQQLVLKHQVAGKQAHDAHLVAAMLVHGIPHLLTFNTADFKRYVEITVVNPSDILAPEE